MTSIKEEIRSVTFLSNFKARKSARKVVEAKITAATYASNKTRRQWSKLMQAA